MNMVDNLFWNTITSVPKFVDVFIPECLHSSFQNSPESNPKEKNFFNNCIPVLPKRVSLLDYKLDQLDGRETHVSLIIRLCLKLLYSLPSNKKQCFIGGKVKEQNRFLDHISPQTYAKIFIPSLQVWGVLLPHKQQNNKKYIHLGG